MFASQSDSVCYLEPVHDDFGALTDARLVAWNGAFTEDFGRRSGVAPWKGMQMSRMSPTPHIFLSHVAEAWTSGRSEQWFTVDHSNSVYADGFERSWRLMWERVDRLIRCQATDLAEWEQMKRELADSASLAAIATRARTLAEDRERIARDLHDTVIQNLYATALELEIVASNGGPDDLRRRLPDITESLRRMIIQIRDEIFDVRSPIVGQLRRELLDVMMPMAGANGVSAEVFTELDAIEDPDLAHNVRAVVREAASNAIRHGHATRLTVTVRENDDELTVEIRDNGTGIGAPPEAMSGLANLRDRAARFGGRFEIMSTGIGGSHWVVGTRLVWSARLDVVPSSQLPPRRRRRDRLTIDVRGSGRTGIFRRPE